MTVSELADRIIEEARRHLGKPYRHAGNGPKVFDCTGFTKYVFDKFGYKLGRTVPSQAKDGREVLGNLSDLQKGDILIFGSRPNTRRMGHAGIFIGMDSTGTNFSFIHAAVKGGIQVNNLQETYYKQRFLGARRILPDFLPEVIDSSAIASLSEALDKVVRPDTLSLSPADRRIILFADGSWALVDSTGALSAPARGERLVLAEGGSWRAVTPSRVTIPDLKELETASQKSSGTTAPPPPADGSAQYHTIVSGDTLSGIAVKYHTTVNALCSLNGISRNSILHLGKKLRVK